MYFQILFYAFDAIKWINTIYYTVLYSISAIGDLSKYYAFKQRAAFFLGSFSEG